MIREELARVYEAATLVNRYNFLTSVGICPEVRRGLTEREIELIAVYSETLSDVSLWTLADLLLEIYERCKKEYPNKKEMTIRRNHLWEQLIRNACKREWNLHTAYNICRTAAAFPFEKRRHTDAISFEHHRLLCGVPEEDRDEWFEKIESWRWTTAKLRYELYAPDVEQKDSTTVRRIVIEQIDNNHAVIHTSEGSIVCTSQTTYHYKMGERP
jgi:hypothetical protein